MEILIMVIRKKRRGIRLIDIIIIIAMHSNIYSIGNCTCNEVFKGY